MVNCGEFTFSRSPCRNFPITFGKAIVWSYHCTVKSEEAVKLLTTGSCVLIYDPATETKVRPLPTFDFSASKSQSRSSGMVTTRFSLRAMVLLFIRPGSWLFHGLSESNLFSFTDFIWRLLLIQSPLNWWLICSAWTFVLKGKRFDSQNYNPGNS